MNGISEHNNNTGASNPTDYMADIIVEQLNKQGDVTKTYDMRGCFPTNLSTIELSYDNENQIEEFTVELQVQYWESGTTS
jgi:hypothetical protein